MYHPVQLDAFAGPESVCRRPLPWGSARSLTRGTSASARSRPGGVFRAWAGCESSPVRIHSQACFSPDLKSEAAGDFHRASIATGSGKPSESGRKKPDHTARLRQQFERYEFRDPQAQRNVESLEHLKRRNQGT